MTAGDLSVDAFSTALSGFRADGNVDVSPNRRLDGVGLSRENWPVTGRQPPLPRVAGTATVEAGWTTGRDWWPVIGMMSTDKRLCSGTAGAL